MGQKVRSLGTWTRVAALALIAAGVGGSWPAFAGAETCPNAAFRSGPAEHLPDCRAYEQLSPVEKNGHNALELGLPAEASSVGDSLAYTTLAAFAGSPGGGEPSAYLGSRSSAWETTPFTPPTPRVRQHADFLSYDFSADSRQAVIAVPLESLAPEKAPADVINLFLRRSDGSYALVTTAPPSAPVQAGCESCYVTTDVPGFAGASSDFGRVIFEVNESLQTNPSAPGGGVHNLYESNLGQPAAERVHPVGILPDGLPAPGGSEPGAGLAIPTLEEAQGTKNVNHAISADGSHILFQAASDGKGPGEKAQTGLTELYDRVNGSSTFEVSAPAPGAEPGPKTCKTKGKVCRAGAAQFWAASADGSQAFFTSKAALTEGSNTGKEAKTAAEEAAEPENPGNDLYRYSVGSKKLTDVTIDKEAKDKNGASVLGVVGTSEDGAYVYFVATGVLAGPNGEKRSPEAGKPNLYLFHESTTPKTSPLTFIATLKEPESEQLLGDSHDWTSKPKELQAYVTPSGEHLGFMSLNPLTGYDNRDPRTGEPVTEVFEYSVANGGTEARLVCASCNPGAAPSAAAFIGARPVEGSTGSQLLSTPFHQPRALSDDGSRLFFSTSEALVAEATTPHVHVYEYESGAVHLISAASGAQDDTFVDASATGNDVFFATYSRLAATDQDDLADIYDARVGGGLQAPPAPPPACAGSACQPPPSAAPSFAAPISPSLVGPGNIPPPPPPVVAHPSAKERLSHAIAKCKKIKNRRKRRRCIAAAKKRYSTPSRSAKRARRASTVENHRTR